MKIMCFKPTSQDWYGNFTIKDDKRYEDMKFVSVSMFQLSDKNWRICVWGNDDFGMEYDTPDPLEAEEIYKTITYLDTVRTEDLEMMNFVRA